VPKRPGNSLISHGSLRSLYTTSDGRHFIVASVGPQTIKRILQAVETHHLAAEIDAGVTGRGSEERAAATTRPCTAVCLVWRTRISCDCRRSVSSRWH
jgi:hypothetical protein